MIIEAYTGETVIIELAVTNALNLTGAICRFSLKGKGTELLKTPTIVGNVLSVRLESNETLVAGKYRYEFRVKIGNDVDSLMFDQLLLKDANIMEVI